MNFNDMPRLVFLAQQFAEHTIAAYYCQTETGRAYHHEEMKTRHAAIEAIMNPGPVEASEHDMKLVIEGERK